MSPQVFMQWNCSLFLPEIGRQQREMGHEDRTVLVMEDIACHMFQSFLNTCKQAPINVILFVAIASGQLLFLDLLMFGEDEMSFEQLRVLSSCFASVMQNYSHVGGVDLSVQCPTQCGDFMSVDSVHQMFRPVCTALVPLCSLQDSLSHLLIKPVFLECHVCLSFGS
jgi:hypothetical protein